MDCDSNEYLLGLLKEMAAKHPKFGKCVEDAMGVLDEGLSDSDAWLFFAGIQRGYAYGYRDGAGTSQPLIDVRERRGA